MAKSIHEIIGSADNLQFEFNLNAANNEKQSLAWGEGIVRFQGEDIWIAQDEGNAPSRVSWSWLDLLEFLARAWPWIVLEETYPIPVTPLHPGKLRQTLALRWEHLAHETVLEEDEEIFRFESHHDLARGMKGIYLPSITLLRQGSQMWVCTQDKVRLLPFDDVMQTLEEVGDTLVKFIGNTNHSRAINVLRIWGSRKEKLQEYFVSLRSGLTQETLSILQGNVNKDIFWGIDQADNYGDTEMLAAARMSANIVGIEEQRALLQKIRELPKKETQLLDKFSYEANNVITDNETFPHEIGYALAKWLRKKLKIKDKDKIDLEKIYSDFGVCIETIKLDNCSVDALACWGKHHGPAVVLNNGEGARPSHPHGKRSSLAHELCHLLVDRQRGLQVAEVLGGLAPTFFERQANAFAAEFLLPREIVSQNIKKGTDFRTVIANLSNNYSVSFQLIGWQIRNSSIYTKLNTDERSYVGQITSEPWERNLPL